MNNQAARIPILRMVAILHCCVWRICAAEVEPNTTVAVEMAPSSSHSVQPGKYIFETAGGYSLCPTCFTIDGTGQFFIPDVTYRYGVRVHKFTSDGQFIETVDLEGTCSSISQIAVAPNTDTLLLMNTANALSYATRYSADGQALVCFGANGELDSALDLPYHIKPKVDQSKRPDFFRASVALHAMPDSEALTIERAAKPRLVSYLAQGGKLRIPDPSQPDQSQKVAAALEKEERLWNLNAGLGKRLSAEYGSSFVYSMIGPDNDYYFMVVTKEKLQILRIDR